MPKLIDWRELYAANQRAIREGGVRLPATSLPAGGLPAMPLPPRESAPEPAPAPPGLTPLPARPDGRRAFVHAPSGLEPGTAAPLLLVLHGCTQSAADVARAMRLHGLAQRERLRVAYAQQGARHNPRGCWNWFEPAHQARGAGEPAFLADVVAAVAERWTTERSRVYVVGFSAGGAMAAVAAAAYPDLFAGLAVHSGLPYAAAGSLTGALAAMRRGGGDTTAAARAVVDAMGPHARPVSAIALHGSADRLVHRANGEQVAAQWRRAAALLDPAGAGDGDPAVVEGRAAGGRAFTRRRWSDRAGRAVAEHVEVGGMAHAWAGGTPGGSYADPSGPSAVELIWRFFAEAAPAAARPALARGA